ncbi:MAG: DUF2726 domain-containing protein [Lachnospiraceae bacterium]|nr:DUF2726 domain-containing protein [Lachnospiraceae bacterium]
MDGIGRDIFKAVHEGKWLSIEYRNKSDSVTKYWIGIKDINIQYKSLSVHGLHLGEYKSKDLYVYIDNIVSSSVVEGTYQPINKELVEDITLNPRKYDFLFKHTANLKILNYLSDCNKMDSIPYQSQYSLIDHLDGDKISSMGYQLSDTQFAQIVSNFQRRISEERDNYSFNQRCLNLLSVNTKKGLYVLAYRQLDLDIRNRTLRPKKEITICKEFTIDGEKQSIRQFLDADEYYLLEEFEKNIEIIKDSITQTNNNINGVDDRPYLLSIARNPVIDLTSEYKAILDMYEKGTVTIPIKAFFGELIATSRGRKKDYPVALVNNRINLDQLLAIHNAMKYPIAYIQGPPGTGKTNTIINTITSAFFNEKTVLFSSYNNHPIDGVFSTLSNMEYNGRTIPFPILRLGNNEKTLEAIEYIKHLYDFTKKISIYDKTLGKNKNDKEERTKRLTELLKKHEEIIELNERKEAIQELHKLNENMLFQFDLEQRQLREVNKRLDEIGTVTDEQALALLTNDEQEFHKYLFYVSAMYVKRLDEPKYGDFLRIINEPSREKRLSSFNKYVSKGENLKKLMRVFPVIATTCISAHRLGEPEPYFDMTIMDEASQCNTAVSLVAILRGNNLMLVGDPQQLNPVVLLDSNVNNVLRRRYGVAPEYDYIANSIYKTYLACDAVSDEILLSYHYRCAREIIDFNNKKYYNGRLKVKSQKGSEAALVFADIQGNTTSYKNTAPVECEKIIQYAKLNKDKSIGVITPFSNQRDYVSKALKDNALENVTCGTVHAFQGDEKDVILFSLAITDRTHPRTYEWLKNNKELVNVSVSRAKEQLIVLSSKKELERLHVPNSEDDIYELVNYVKSNGVSEVTPKDVTSRALGIKPYSTETEEAFLQTLNHALDNILYTDMKCSVEREVAISQVFKENVPYVDLFYTGRFDFVIYQRDYNRQKMPILAIELDGKEHVEDDIVRARDEKKNEICRSHGFELIRVENSYARRYNYIKDVLISYFGKARK